MRANDASFPDETYTVGCTFQIITDVRARARARSGASMRWFLPQRADVFPNEATKGR